MEPKNSTSDSRYFPRWQSHNDVHIQLSSDSPAYKGKTLDLSCAGASIAARNDIPLHQKVELKIQLSSDCEVKVTGEVIWSRMVDKHVQLGVTFFNTPAQVQDLILEHAFEINKKELLKHWYKGWFGPQ